MTEPAMAESVQVPATAFVPCPATGFKNVPVARRCAACPEFRGFTEVQEAGAFDARYRVNCAHLIARRMISVEVD